MLMVAMAATPAAAQTYTLLYNFGPDHGIAPKGVLAEGRDGNLYGTTLTGGISVNGGSGFGVVFRITPTGKLDVLHKFDSYDAFGPRSGVTLSTDGNFFGTTVSGGDASCDGTGYAYDGCGTVFKITASGSFAIVHTFTIGTGGIYPRAPLIQADDGSFYGTTPEVNVSTHPPGIAYKITPSGNYTVLASIPGGYGRNGGSIVPLLQGTDGNFYGTSGVAAFKITPQGILTTVYDFIAAANNGNYLWAPDTAPIQGDDGNFYGTTGGGIYGLGAVYKLTPQGAITVLHNFPDPNYPNDGNSPEGLFQATDGTYGVTCKGGSAGGGVLFQITRAGDYSVLYNFPNGLCPDSIPMQHTNGKIYGLSSSGGRYKDGVLYSLDLGLAPFVRLVSTSGKVGTSITILGQGFTGTTNVSFNGTPATFKVWSDTFLKATVPSGATTGSVTVTSASGSLTSNHPFRVHPVILSVAPATGAAGTPVVITGTSLSQTTRVTFGGGKAAATFTVDSDTQVTATVPAGAPSGYILLTTPGGRSRSQAAFTVTP
jgi:uncharacterized repeat protein (TIGR03803 family)